MFTNDIPRPSSGVQLALFVDHTALYLRSTCLPYITPRRQRAIDELIRWFQLWRIEAQSEPVAPPRDIINFPILRKQTNSPAAASPHLNPWGKPKPRCHRGPLRDRLEKLSAASHPCRSRFATAGTTSFGATSKRCSYQPRQDGGRGSEREVPASSDRRKFPPIFELIRAKTQLSPREHIPLPSTDPERELSNAVARVREFRNESWSDLMEEIKPSHKAFWAVTKALKTEDIPYTPLKT
ncbi:hypothetical protein EVAR_37896_1 [Eumeta japonica]|uniref:RNA-directed DNA polymerase from mobile element jockey n=1 Tax=Eumeta variegata TaxID=151549 RepID=A0A4C1Y580_EUMVA|nr:hypothetical protein EVAR_37896_1 [Eumeta japonica]